MKEEMCTMMKKEIGTTNTLQKDMNELMKKEISTIIKREMGEVKFAITNDMGETKRDLDEKIHRMENAIFTLCETTNEVHDN